MNEQKQAGCGASCAKKGASPVDFRAKLSSGSSVKKVIGIVSGKGGVGKSLVTSMMAVKTRSKGYKTAILDADITGPSIPKAFGLSGKIGVTGDKLLVPMTSTTGIDIISTNLILENDSDPVIWRGPIIAGVVKQFWGETLWNDIDFMYVDMPPGTGDVPLTVFQSLPVDGIIIVTSPQELVAMIVEKALNMAEKMNIPVLGIIENMSYFVCDNCDKKHFIYGESHIEEIAAEHGLKVISRLPIIPEAAEAVDKGRIEFMDSPWFDAAAEEVIARLKDK